MNKVLFIFIILVGVLISSCVPHKKIVYLQNKSAATDSIQRIKESPKPYRVQISDILNIRVKALDQNSVSIFNPIGEDILSASGDERAYFDGFTVDVHGQIRVPALGKISVLGYTTEEIENLLEKRLLEQEFKETANIFVTVKLSGLRYTASGEIGSPGTQVVYQQRMNIYEAIANAGEIPITGDKTDVQIIRQYPSGQKIHHLDLTDRNVMNSPYYYIQPNDMIYVKPIKQKTWGTGTTGRESLTAIFSVLSVITTIILLINR